ncbi:T-lymphocyte activation antigen CD86 isoform X2 [Otolemur garnettii]|nr:T-lymphocyte activation antigen CD86 isoform X2 [Otolemur garnettii]
MILIYILCAMGFLLCPGADSQNIQAYFNKTAHLPCPFTNSQNLSWSELVVFWQNKEKLVLYELYLGKEKSDNVNRKYMGRTSFDWENWTLRLHNVQIKDKGSYQCFIQHKRPTGLVLIYQMSSDLSVLANFSQPEIMPMSNKTENLYINLTCSSTQGYPKPKKMSFWLTTENSTIEYDGVMQKSQDKVTELYNVSISSSLSLPDTTSNKTILCVLETEEPAKMRLFSSPFYIASEDPPHQDNNVWIAAALISVFIPCVLLLLWRCKKKTQHGVSHQSEAINDDRKENEPTEQREEVHAPERFDEEVQDDANSSKMPSDDKSATSF